MNTNERLDRCWCGFVCLNGGDQKPNLVVNNLVGDAGAGLSVVCLWDSVVGGVWFRGGGGFEVEDV